MAHAEGIFLDRCAWSCGRTLEGQKNAAFCRNIFVIHHIENWLAGENEGVAGRPKKQDCESRITRLLASPGRFSRDVRLVTSEE